MNVKLFYKSLKNLNKMCDSALNIFINDFVHKTWYVHNIFHRKCCML